jgi:hypothetical protein
MITARLVPKSVRFSASDRATTFNDPGFKLPSTSLSFPSTLIGVHTKNFTVFASSTATGGCLGGSVVVVVVVGGGGGGFGVVVVVVVLLGPEWPGSDLPPLFFDFGFGVPTAPPLPDEVAAATVDRSAGPDFDVVVDVVALPAPVFGPVEPGDDAGRDVVWCGAEGLATPPCFVPGASSRPEALM